MEDGLLSLKWNNHRSTFFHILSEVRGKQTYTDATLACEGKFFPVHKLVMSTCSDYFGEIFEKTPCKNPVVVLKDIKKSDLEALLDYMYIGEVDVRQSELAGLIKAAECLRIKGLAVPDEDPTKAHKKGPPVPDPPHSPPAKRKRRDSPSPPLPRGSSQSSSAAAAPVPSQAPPPSASVPESHVPSQPMPPPAAPSQEAGRARQDGPPSGHLHHPQLRGAPEGLRSPPGDSSHGAGASPRAPDPSILPVQMIKVEVDEGGEGGGAGRESHGGEREEGSEMDDNEEDASNDFSEYPTHTGEIEKEEHDQVDSYGTDQLPGPSGLQGGPPVLAWGEEGEAGFPHNLFGGDDAAAQQAAVQRKVTELGGGRLVCPMCPRTFASVDDLTRHIPMHTFDKLYRCQQCLYRTDSRSNLQRHLRTHTGEKRHGCPVCKYRAGQRSDLRRHLRVHAMKQSNAFKCRMCGASSSTATAFARHILDAHAGSQNNRDEPPSDPHEEGAGASEGENTLHPSSVPTATFSSSEPPPPPPSASSGEQREGVTSLPPPDLPPLAPLSPPTKSPPCSPPPRPFTPPAPELEDPPKDPLGES